MKIFQRLLKWLSGDPIAECSAMLLPCPVCGHKAVLIQVKDVESGLLWYHAECGAFDDHGAWTLPNPCNFYGIGYSGFCGTIDGAVQVPHHLSPKKAALWWNEVVVPIAKLTLPANDRNQNKVSKPHSPNY